MKNAVEHIIDRIKRDATERAKEHIRKGQKEAGKIETSIEVELEKERKAISLENEKAMKMLRGRALSEAKLEARKLKLNIKEDAIKRTFQEANKKLQALGPSETEQYLRRAITNASKILHGNMMVQCREKDRQLMSSIVAGTGGRAQISPESIDCLGGVIIHSADKTARIDATFDGLLERLRNDLRKEVAEILFKDQVELQTETS